MWHGRIVLIHPESDQSLDTDEAVERMQVQPVVT
jgi:hypothetical protein